MKVQRICLVLPVALLLLFALAACGGMGDGEDNEGPVNVTPAAGSEGPDITVTQAWTTEPVMTGTVGSEVGTAETVTSNVQVTDSVTDSITSEVTATETTETISPTVMAGEGGFSPSSELAMYQSEAAGIEVAYPADWTVQDLGEVGGRGSAAILLSPGSSAEMIADGGSRVSIVTYVWDPKNDLDAWVAQRKTAWEASGFPIVREEDFTLDDGRPAHLVLVDGPDTRFVTLLTTAGDNYVDLTGEGDLELAEQIVRSVTSAQ